MSRYEVNTDEPVHAESGIDTDTKQKDSKPEDQEERMTCCDRIIAGYASVVVRFPWLVILLVFVFSGIFAGVAFSQTELPDFSDPIKGFESRGTYIKGAELSHDHLVNKDTVSPEEPIDKRRKRDNKFDTSGLCFSIYELNKDTVDYGYEKFVFTGFEDKDLFTKEAMQEICSYEDEVVMTSQYFYNYYYSNNESCRGLSLGHLVGLLSGPKDCMELTEQDISDALKLIQMCEPLITSATDDVAIEVCNKKVYNHNIIYIITHFLVDSEFLQNGNTKATYSMLMHSESSLDALEFYQETIEGDLFSGTYVELVAFGSDIKFDLFNIYVTQDLYLFIIAIVSILVIMILYLRSLTVTIATLFDIGFSFVMSYFFYHIVFRLSFFPFMNLLSGLVLIAVGADDVFVFTDIWLQEKAHHQETHSIIQLKHTDRCSILIKTFKHAALSIFVTSLSTASAFLANMVSEITSIKCFGVFSALCIICNFVFMITWVPAIIVLMDKVNEWLTSKLSKYGCYKQSQNCFEKVERFLGKINATVYERFFPYIMAKLWLLWIILTLVLGIGGFIVTFGVPKLSLPTSNEFQFFASSNPLEVYDLKLKQKFHFFHENTQSDFGMSVAYVFGVHNKDNGNHFDPDKTGSLSLDSNVQFSHPEVADFLTTFCSDLLKASFVSNYTKTYGICALNRLKDVVTLSCSDVNPFRSPCCGQSWPLSEEDFDTCLFIFISQPLDTSNFLGVPYLDSSGTKVEGFTISFASNQDWTSTFSTMENLFKETKAFLDDRLSNGPEMLENGFVDFYGNMDFYDLQKALSQGTYIAIGISLVCALLVMLISTLNILISLYAIVSITMAIIVTIAVLVLLGWELNILESVAITLAVGLSIDFTIHYGVAYMISKSTKRAEKVKSSFRSVGSAVLMAALTTFVAGASVASSQVLSYSRLGTFLMLVMTFSWIYSTFLFQSLCHIFGPEGRFMQIPNPFQCRCCKTPKSKTTEDAEIGSDTKDKHIEQTPPSALPASKEEQRNGTFTEGVDNPAYTSESPSEIQVKSAEGEGLTRENTSGSATSNSVQEVTVTSHL